MYEELIEKVRTKTLEEEVRCTANMEPGTKVMRPPASEASVQQAEQLLGFELHPLLKEIYLQLGNGGVGPVCGILGLDDGTNDDDTLAATYKEFVTQDALKPEWPAQLLPFLDWGCGKYALVDRETGMIFTNEHPNIWSEGYNIQEFFELWVGGGDIWRNAEVEVITKIGANPFTKEPMEFRTEKRTGKEAFVTFSFRE